MYLENLHALYVKLVTAWEAHDLAHAINVFFKTHHTFDLATHILFPLSRKPTRTLLALRSSIVPGWV
jgi:hypothetical protein